MVTFLLTMIVLSGCILVGYRLNMYLYKQSVVRNHTRTVHQIPSVPDDSASTQAVYEEPQQERPHGLRYASIGILLMAGILGVLVIYLIVALSLALH